MKKLIKHLASAVVDSPEAIKIEEHEKEEGILEIDLYVNEEDMGRIIGKNGKVIKSIRQIAQIKAAKNEQKVFINLEEN
jgi:hypothetical protein